MTSPALPNKDMQRTHLQVLAMQSTIVINGYLKKAMEFDEISESSNDWFINVHCGRGCGKCCEEAWDQSKRWILYFDDGK